MLKQPGGTESSPDRVFWLVHVIGLGTFWLSWI